MACFTEKHLEQMIWGETAADGIECGHLFQCDRCRERYLALAILHQALLSSSSAYPLVFPKSPIAVAARTIWLQPLQPGIRGVSSFPRLAAKGEQPDDPYHVCSYTNADAGLIGRLLYHLQSRRLTLYLIADANRNIEGLKATLDDGYLTGYSDHQGCIDFGEQPERSFEKLEISTPRGIYDLSRSSPTPAAEDEKQQLVLAGHPRAEIDLTIDRQPEGTRYIITRSVEASAPESAELDIVGITSKRILPVKTRGGAALLQVEPDEEMLKIHIY